MTGTPGWAWAAASGVILGLLALDLAANRGQQALRRAVLVSAGWVAAAVAFGAILIAWRGGGAGQEYFTAYLVEKALSIDNIFVFALLFEAFAVPAAYQHRVLFAGIAGALALRAGFIAAGATLLEHLAWAGYLFGALLIAAAVRMARGGPTAGAGHRLVARALRTVMPVSDGYDGARFLTRIDGKLAATPLLAVLVVIETTDVIFAADSIPAALGVTTDMFLVFTSNAFAVLGLRALYFVLAGALREFGYLRQGLTVMLAFIGLKMLLAGVVHIPATLSLGVIILIITTAVLLSVAQRSRRPTAAAGPRTGAGPGTAAGSHNLHTGCAGPASRPALLDGSTGPVAREDEHHSGALLAADATARPGHTAVAK
jgi:tellurite resistance protein TerC